MKWGEWSMRRPKPKALSFGVDLFFLPSERVATFLRLVISLGFVSCVCVSPCLFQRCPLIDREVTALREILEEVGVISTWILRAPSLLLLFSAAPCSDDLMALPTWEEQKKNIFTNIQQTRQELYRSAGQLATSLAWFSLCLAIIMLLRWMSWECIWFNFQLARHGFAQLVHCWIVAPLFWLPALCERYRQLCNCYTL